jgi:hypothetical protein
MLLDGVWLLAYLALTRFCFGRMDMRRSALVLILGLGLLAAAPLAAQQAQSSLAPGLSSGLGSGLNSGLSSGLNSALETALGTPTPRTLADPFNPYAQLQGGGDCAPLQIDPDHTGCRPYAWLKSERPNPNRIVTYYGDTAFRPRFDEQDPNRVQTYSGDSALRGW